MIMKKIVSLLTSLLLLAAVTSCSSDSDVLSGEDTPEYLEELAGLHSDIIDESLLPGAWVEVSVISGSNGVFDERRVPEEYARYRFNITEGKTLTQYIADKGLYKVKGVREYDYDPETRRFDIVGNMLEVNVPYVIDYLTEETLILSSTVKFKTQTSIVKLIFQRVPPADAALWEADYKPEIRGMISDYGVYLGDDKDWHLLEGAEPFSASKFRELIVGHPLKAVESHKILDDGSIYERQFGNWYEFLFSETDLQLITTRTCLPSDNEEDWTLWVEDECPYTYDESQNKVCSAQQLIVLSYDEEKDQVLAILRPFNWFVVYQRMPMEWWTEMEALATPCMIVSGQV